MKYLTIKRNGDIRKQFSQLTKTPPEGKGLQRKVAIQILVDRFYLAHRTIEDIVSGKN